MKIPSRKAGEKVLRLYEGEIEVPETIGENPPEKLNIKVDGKEITLEKEDPSMFTEEIPPEWNSPTYKTCIPKEKPGDLDNEGNQITVSYLRGKLSHIIKEIYNKKQFPISHAKYKFKK
jgi:hypothetical protein